MPKQRKQSTALAITKPPSAIIKRSSVLRLTESESKLFDINTVYENSSDAKGHSEEMRLRVPKGTLATIHEVLNRAPQYKNQQTFLRTWLVHGLTYTTGKLDRQEPFESNKFMRHILEMERLEAEAASKAEEAGIDATKEELDEAIELDHQRDMERLRQHINALLDLGPSCDNYRTKLEALKQKLDRHLPPEETE